jgi:hypothetical protein
MALPAQIQRQTEAVNDMYRQMNTEPAPAETGNPAVQPADASGVETSNPPSAPVEQAADTKSEETLLQQYRTLQGKYNAEIPRLAAERRELTNRVQQLEQLIASMNAKPAPAPAPVEKLITEDELRDYGDSIEVMRKVFREEMASKDAEIAELKNLVRQVQGTVVPQVQRLSQNYAVSSEQQFWATLESEVPGWQTVNADKDFHSWLLEVDPLTGMTRQTYLDDAQRSMDARRVANFFKTWMGMRSVPDARPNPGAQAASELERQIAPGKGRAAGSKAQGEPKTYTPAEIRNFFADVQRGRYKGNEAERNRIERDIFAAQREGRIVNA